MALNAATLFILRFFLMNEIRHFDRRDKNCEQRWINVLLFLGKIWIHHLQRDFYFFILLNKKKLSGITKQRIKGSKLFGKKTLSKFSAIMSLI